MEREESIESHRLLLTDLISAVLPLPFFPEYPKGEKIFLKELDYFIMVLVADTEIDLPNTSKDDVPEVYLSRIAFMDSYNTGSHINAVIHQTSTRALVVFGGLTSQATIIRRQAYEFFRQYPVADPSKKAGVILEGQRLELLLFGDPPFPETDLFAEMKFEYIMETIPSMTLEGRHRLFSLYPEMIAALRRGMLLASVSTIEAMFIPRTEHQTELGGECYIYGDIRRISQEKEDIQRQKSIKISHFPQPE